MSFGVTVSPPWTQLMPVCYGFARWSYGGDTVHAGRATVMPRNKLALFRSPGFKTENARIKHTLTIYNQKIKKSKASGV